MVLRQDLERPPAQHDELLLAVRAAGICGTDLEMLAGYADFTGVPGHEFVANVLAGPADWIGKRVVASINVGCGQCEYCARGMVSHCINREVIGIRGRNGAFAALLTAPAANAHPVPDHIDDKTAVLVEPLAAALEIAEQVTLTGQERVLVIGAGRLSQLIAQVLVTMVGEVDVLVRNPARRPSFSPLAVRMIDAPGGGYDLVVECSGSSQGLNAAMQSVRPRGTIIMKSTVASSGELSLNDVVVNEIAVVGSRCGPFDKAIRWLAEGRLDTAHLTFETYPLADWQRAFERAKQPDVYKVLLVPD